MKKGVLKNLSEFTGKHLSQSPLIYGGKSNVQKNVKIPSNVPYVDLLFSNQCHLCSRLVFP